jgi:hypothetical protein
MQEGGIDHFQLTDKRGSIRKGPQRARFCAQIDTFWQKLVKQGHTSNIDVLDVLDPPSDLCIMLSRCSEHLLVRVLPSSAVLFQHSCIVTQLCLSTTRMST